MKTWQSIAAALFFCIPIYASADAGGTVFYRCQQGKSLSIRYSFNSQGIPTQARATLNGQERKMAYDLERSDNVDTFFKDRNGYRVGSAYMDKDNYRTQQIILTGPDDQILYKDCKPEARSEERMTGKTANHAQSAQVAYLCQNDRRINVSYRFNSAGIPTRAAARLQGRKLTLHYNQNRSDDVDTFFNGHGYSLTTGYMDAENYRSQSITITAPNDVILYKDCSSVR